MEHDTLDRIARALRAVDGPVDPAALRDDMRLSRTRVATAVHRLQEAGLIEVHDDGQIEAADRGADLEAAVDKPPCGRCDACDAGRGTNGVATTDGPFGLGARVEHPEWGAGTVQRSEDDMLTVVFDGVG